MPASVFSRSTECHNQDKVSMGTIAARDCQRVLQLTEQVASAVLLACCQGVELRIQKNDINENDVSLHISAMIDSIRQLSAFLEEDRALDKELHLTINSIQKKSWTLYSDNDYA
jgi:histidine ammonia-lyase